MRLFLSQKKLSFILSVTISLVLILPIAFEIDIPFIHSIELKTRDLRFRERGPVSPGENILIVAIDDKSIKAIGRWPWPRSVFAQLIAELYEAGARVIGFDLLFTEAETNSEKIQLQDLIGSHTQLGLLDGNAASQAFFDEMVDAVDAADNDRLLSSVMEETGHVVSAMAFVSSSNKPNPFPAYLEQNAYESFKKTSLLSKFSPVSFQEALLSVSIIANASSQIGFVNFIPDPDGVIRKGILALEHGGALFAPLSVRVAQRYF